jgi:hypothetical protein
MVRGACPLCAASPPVAIEYRQSVPVLLNRLAGSLEHACSGSTGVLDIVGCNRCGFVWNRSFDPEKIPYDPEYENDQTHSIAFRAHLEEMIARVLDAAGSDGPIDLVEVGCGQGVFLRTVISRADTRLRSIVGFDPAFRAASAIPDSRARVYTEYFNEQAVARMEHDPSIVVSRHTIEHVADPIGFLSAIRRGIRKPGARLFVETPDVDWIVKRGEVEDLFYEHCSLFNPESLSFALSSANFEPVRVERVFDEQYLWAEAVATDAVRKQAPARGRTFPDLSKAREAFVETWRERIAGRSAVVWGAGAKGVTFCSLVDPNRERIAGVIDINPGKQEKYVPVTGHGVHAPSALLELRPELVIIMNPNYRAEISALLREMGIAANILVIGDEKESAA